MEFTGWQLAGGVIASGVAGGIVFWLLARLAIIGSSLLPQRPPFADNLLSGGGDRERSGHLARARDLAALFAALLAAMLFAAAAWWLLPAMQKPALPDWLWIAAIVLGVIVVALAVYSAARIVLARRRLQFAWAAKTAVGNVLKRLNLAGNSIFHDVVTETATIDHVVVGRKGVFALNVVARPVPKQAERASAELKNGKLWFGSVAEALPVGDAARNMTLLSSALSKVAGHRVPVRSVLVVPGWHTLPNGEGNHLVLSERNLAMLTSWNTPDAYLMDEDCIAIHSFLHEASRVRRLR